jgi:protein phosphatase
LPILQVCSKTDIGLVRSSNQDACDVGILADDKAWAVVCDGMGGTNGGNIASTLAVQQISRQIRSCAPAELADDRVMERMVSAVRDANAAIYEKARAQEGLRGMGTTVVLAVALGPAVYVAHAGDSRAYLISPDGDIRQLTVDHSMVQELVDKGDLTEQEAKVHPQKNIITRALGVQPSVEVDFCSHPFPPGGRLLICTDGLSNNVGTKQISQLSKQLGPEEFCERLISLAKDAGGSDNITVAIIEN